MTYEEILNELWEIELRYGSAVIRTLAAKMLIEHELLISEELINELKNLRGKQNDNPK